MDTPDQFNTSNRHQIDTKSCNLSPFQSMIAACILEETIDQLVVLSRIRNLPKVKADLVFKDFNERFDDNMPDNVLYDPETLQPYEKSQQMQKFKKFQLDRSYTEQVIQRTVKDVIEKNNFCCLVTHLCEFDRNLCEENALLARETENREELKKIRVLIEKERRELNNEIQKQAEIIGNAKDEYEDLFFENGLKLSYVENWEAARNAQNHLRLTQREQHNLDIIATAKTNIDREIRINAEISAFIKEIQTEYENEIEKWMTRYDKEIEVRDLEIQNLKEKREEQTLSLQSISNLYKKHKLEIEEYLQLKEKRRQEEQEEKRREMAATKIQAWWKGVMVRKGFGKFRKKKGKRGGADKKKGKK